jgi:hypothetical protein
MWKFVLVLLISALAILIAQLVSDAPVIQHASLVSVGTAAFLASGGEGGLRPHHKRWH